MTQIPLNLDTPNLAPLGLPNHTAPSNPSFVP